MASTIVGYFDDYTTARRAEQDLLNAGIGAQHVQVVGRDADGKTTENWWDRFKSAFGVDDEDDRRYYEQAAERGALLSVRVASDAQLEEVATIIERHHPVDLSRKNEEWNASAGTTRASTTHTASANASAHARTDVSATGERIPLAQEELHVGKRAVARGALRVHSYVTETPVTEKVNLREEQAFVERTAVNREVAPGDATFKERTIEVQELGEEAVVDKRARVVEEVHVGKQQTQREETVRDTVRKQEVDVARTDGRGEVRTDKRVDTRVDTRAPVNPAR